MKVDARGSVASRCPGCGGTRSAPRFEVGDYCYVACVGCGSARLEPVPPLDPELLYGAGYFVDGTELGGYVDYVADEAIHRRNARDRIARAARYLPGRSALSLIDIGCAAGYVLDAARDAGWTAHGVDVSPWARETSARRGHQVSPSLTEALRAAPEPDVVSFFQVLEHLEHPDEAIAEAAAALRPGGVLVVETWDAASLVARVSGKRWQQANPPTVLHLLSRRGAERLLTLNDLQVVESRRTSKTVSVGLVAGVIAHRAPGLGRPLLHLTGATPLGKLGVRYGLGDLVTLVAVKRRTGQAESR